MDIHLMTKITDRLNILKGDILGQDPKKIIDNKFEYEHMSAVGRYQAVARLVKFWQLFGNIETFMDGNVIRTSQIAAYFQTRKHLQTIIDVSNIQIDNIEAGTKAVPLNEYHSPLFQEIFKKTEPPYDIYEIRRLFGMTTEEFMAAKFINDCPTIIDEELLTTGPLTIQINEVVIDHYKITIRSSTSSYVISRLYDRYVTWIKFIKSCGVLPICAKFFRTPTGCAVQPIYGEGEHNGFNSALSHANILHKNLCEIANERLGFPIPPEMLILGCDIENLSKKFGKLPDDSEHGYVYRGLYENYMRSVVNVAKLLPNAETFAQYSEKIVIIETNIKKSKSAAKNAANLCVCAKIAQLTCSKCKIKKYCSRTCQVDDWTLHKQQCAAKPSLST